MDASDQPCAQANNAKIICAAFQRIGAAKDKKNFLCAFRTPKHQDERTMKPSPAHIILTKLTVSSNVSSGSNGRRTLLIGLAARIPIITIAEVSNPRRVTMVPATNPGSSLSSFPSIRRLYVGMKEADNVPSPSIFWSKPGICNAALKASAATLVPSKPAKISSRTRPDSRDSKIPAPTIIAFRPLGLLRSLLGWLFSTN